MIPNCGKEYTKMFMNMIYRFLTLVNVGLSLLLQMIVNMKILGKNLFDNCIGEYMLGLVIKTKNIVEEI
uniref:Putative secreted protein n=1 Tax=Xenopsylla cheopis TaxID=163159 RepID=A0A6M2DW57_XENCH